MRALRWGSWRASGRAWRLPLVLVVLSHCGRIGYALLDETDETRPGDAGGTGRTDAPVGAARDSGGGTAAEDAGAPLDDGATLEDVALADVALEDVALADATLEDVADAKIVADAMDATAELDPDASLDGSPGDARDGGADGADASETSCVVSPIVDYCSGVPSLPAPPVIDGVLDPCGPTLVPITPVGWIGPSPLPPLPSGNSSELAVAWRPDGLYVFIAVTTPAYFASPEDAGTPIYYGAGVEIFVDSTGVYTDPPAVNDPGGIQLIVEAPPDATTEGQRGDYYRDSVDEGPWTSNKFGTFPTANGFNFEGFVAAADLGLATWTLQAGQNIGFDLAVDVSYTTASMTGSQGYRVGQYFFHVAAPPVDGGTAIGQPFADPRSWCTPTLAP